MLKRFDTTSVYTKKLNRYGTLHIYLQNDAICKYEGRFYARRVVEIIGGKCIHIVYFWKD